MFLSESPEAAIARFLAPGRHSRLGVAVSGGGDSMALLHLLAGQGVDLHVVTVDHGLRAEAATEAALVGRAAADLGLPHDILRWHWDRNGNLPDQARRARLALIGAWARKKGLAAVLLAHTADDQAETLLMRLARGSGVDGLSGMSEVRAANGILWLRPLLRVRRDALRCYLQATGIDWAEDPTNADPAYDRVRIRQALAILGPLGIDVDRLCQTAAMQAQAREALALAAHDLAESMARADAGDLVFDRTGFAAAPVETRLRLLSQGLRWVASAEYRPRLEAVSRAEAAINAGKRHSLAGCLILTRLESFRITREPRAALAAPAVEPGILWDRRWRLVPENAGVSGALAREADEIRALGEAGLAHFPDWRAIGLPRPTLISSPAVWRGNRLLAAPLAGMAAGWRAELMPEQGDFLTSLLYQNTLSH